MNWYRVVNPGDVSAVKWCDHPGCDQPANWMSKAGYACQGHIVEARDAAEKDESRHEVAARGRLLGGLR